MTSYYQIVNETLTDAYDAINALGGAASNDPISVMECEEITHLMLALDRARTRFREYGNLRELRDATPHLN